MKPGFFAVKVGRVPGIYETWEECEKQTKGFSRPSYRKFKTREEAEAFMNEDEKKIEIDESIPMVYVDGSIFYSYKTGILVYGYGYVIITPNGEITEHSGNMIDDIETDKLSDDIIQKRVSMRNISGELFGTMKAIKECISRGYKEINILHDYEGIALFANGDWKSKNPEILKYKEYIETCGVKVHFYSVDAHTGVKYNEKADQLAKNGASACYDAILYADDGELKHYKDLILSIELK